MFIRIFGLLGLMLASGYFVNGLTLLIRIYKGLDGDDFKTLANDFASMSLDLFFAVVLVIVAVGLFLAQRWARKMWLITMSILALLHLALTVLYQLGDGIDTVHVVWTWMVVLLTALSWWYFNKRATINN
jgi:hypothetical protein